MNKISYNNKDDILRQNVQAFIQGRNDGYSGRYSGGSTWAYSKGFREADNMRQNMQQAMAKQFNPDEMYRRLKR